MPGLARTALNALTVLLIGIGVVVASNRRSALEGDDNGGRVNIGIGEATGMPGTEVAVPVVVLNQTDQGVVRCAFTVYMPTTGVARFIGLESLAESWDVTWDDSPQTRATDGDHHMYSSSTEQRVVAIQASARSVQHSYGPLEIVHLRFVIGSGAVVGQSMELAIGEARVRSSSDDALTTTISSGRITVGTPPAEPGVLSILACAASPTKQCAAMDVNGDDTITVEDAVVSILRRSALNVCLRRDDERVRVILDGPKRLSGMFAAYHLRVVNAQGLLGLRVRLATIGTCRIVTESPALRGVYAIGDLSTNRSAYTIAMATGDPVISNDTVDVFGIKVMMESGQGKMPCFTIEDWEAYASAECTGVVAGSDANGRSVAGMFCITDAGGGALSSARVNVVGRGGILVRGNTGPAELRLYDLGGRLLRRRHLRHGAGAATVGADGVPSGLYVLVVSMHQSKRRYAVHFQDR